ncbi:MAG TPA: hypothetical protein VN688_09080 [Gemmataceae bacterium]|nr:hypothetical protein [Gemmataceae bacterium]
MSPEEEIQFWLQASETSLAEVWDNLQDNDYAKLAEIADVRQAYPLMDAVARQEGWDDPEMDSYNPLPPTEGNQRDEV